MAADIKKIIANLFEFYNFNDQIIISVSVGKDIQSMIRLQFEVTLTMIWVIIFVGSFA